MMNKTAVFDVPIFGEDEYYLPLDFHIKKRTAVGKLF